MANEALLDLHDVSKDYESDAGVVHALRGVNLRIDHGEFVAIVGASGSGKSTLMNILGCLDRPTHGVYSIGGIDVGSPDQDARAIVRNRMVGFIFQGFNLLSRTTALENVELPLQYRGIGSRARRKRAEQALSDVGLTDRAHHTPNQLSGGQQQRVAIARALVTDPPLLLADEPTGNLDTRTSLEVLALLQRLNRMGRTVVVVTHERDIAACASRVITVRDGRIVSDVRQDQPTDAAIELAALPPAELHTTPPLSEVASQARRERPIPWTAYTQIILSGAAGSGIAMLYCTFILEQRITWILIAGAVLGEAWAARRTLGRTELVTTPSDALRASIVTSCVVAILACIAMVVVMSVPTDSPSPRWVESLSRWNLSTVVTAAVLWMVAATLARALVFYGATRRALRT